MFFGCFGKRRKAPKPTIIRSPSPGCRCSCHHHDLLERRQVIASCDPQEKYELQNYQAEKGNAKRAKSPGSRSLDRPRSPRTLGRSASFTMDITYITERIIALSFPESANQTSYRNNLSDVAKMLKFKHGKRYMVFNLSEKRYDLSKFNPQVLDFGWPQHLAPPLERLCSLCKSLESWLNSDPNHVAVLHSKGDKGRIGVVVAAYMHYTNICSSAEQALDKLAMKRFYDDKLSSSMHPSQRRYVQYFGGLLSGAIKMKNRPLYLQNLIIHGVPNFEPKGGCKVFIKIYQGMQSVYTSGVYTVGERARRIVMKIEPSLALRGDVLIKCYHKRARPPGRFPVFRLQFHTCTISDDPQDEKIVFMREELDDAIYDSRFPLDGRVEVQFSANPKETAENGSALDAISSVDGVHEPMVKWDSYENFDLIPEDNMEGLEGVVEQPKTNTSSHLEGPLDGSLYATIGKKTLVTQNHVTSSPTNRNSLSDDLDGPHTISMDSGISSASGAPSGAMPGANTWESSGSPMTPNNPPQTLSNGNRNHQPLQPGGDESKKNSSIDQEAANQSDQAQLDELLNGMLRDIESIPDTPSFSYGSPRKAPSTPQRPMTKFSTITMSSSTPRSSSSYSSTSPTSGLISINGNKSSLSNSSQQPSWMTEHVFSDEGEDDRTLPYHSRKTSMPFSYGIAPDSPAIQRRRFLSDSNAPINSFRRHDEFLRELSTSPEPYSYDENSTTWLQRQQMKLKARREGRGQDRQQIEHRLIQELRSSTHARKTAEEEATEKEFRDTLRAMDPSAVSREPSPSKTSPLHVITYTNGYSTTLPNGGNSKPPIGKTGTSAPCSPVIPSRTSSKEITKSRFQHWQPPTLSRQKSDTSYDRERPFMSVKRTHQAAKDQMTTNGKDAQLPEDLLAFGGLMYPYQRQNSYQPPSRQISDDLSDTRNLMAMIGEDQGSPVFNEPLSFSPGSSGLGDLEKSLKALTYKSEPTSFTMPTPINQNHFNGIGNGPTSGRLFTSSPIVATPLSERAPTPSAADRAATPSFPVAPRTPYVNQDSPVSAAGLPPKSPTLSRKERSPSPSTLQALRLGLTNQNSTEQPPSSVPFTENGQSSPSVYFGHSRRASLQSLSETGEVIHHHPLFVKDTSKYWYKPDISRENAISLLKDKSPGTFIVRDSNSFPGAYGLALKVATPPPNVQNKSGDLSNELVRHFLIEPTTKGVRLKGCPNEPVFGTLSALVYQHSITALALPCKLLLPESDLEEFNAMGELGSTTSSLLSQGAACNVLYLNTLDMESLTGPQAVRKALAMTLEAKLIPEPTTVHFKASNQGITLTDNHRKLFFRRHYPVNTITYCGLDPDDCRWTVKNEAGMPVSSNRCFGFVARKPASQTDNQCHVFAELDPDQPASAIVNFVTKVMMTGNHHPKVNMV